LQQYLIVGLNEFGAQVIERCRALPIDRNVVYHALACPPEKRVATAYLDYRQELLNVLNREVFNFANTPLAVYLVGLMVEQHMAENLMHLGYLFKTFFRENITLNPRVKLISALPTILPEPAFAWLPQTRRALEAIDGYAALKSPFTPAYPEVKRTLPSISGPPFEEIAFCYSESMDAEDVDVSTQAAATLIYFDLVVRPARVTESSAVAEFARSRPVGRGFAPVTGCAVAFLPSLAKLVRDEMEYVLVMRLVERFFGAEPPEATVLDPLVEGVLRKVGALRLRDLVDEVTRVALEEERWFDPAALDAAARFDIEMSPSPDAYLNGLLAALERDRTRCASRVHELALERLQALPARILEAIRESQPRLDLRAIEALLTAACGRVIKQADGAAALVRQARDELEAARHAAGQRVGQLKELAGAKDARFKHGSETERRAAELLRSVDMRGLLRLGLGLSVAEAWAHEQADVETRLREGYERLHAPLSGFLKRRGEMVAHLASRRDAYLRRRELHLYVFNQVFRQRVLDAEIERAFGEVPQLAQAEPLAPLLGTFFFKHWFGRPELGLDEVEVALLEAVRVDAGREVQAIAGRINVDYSAIVRILGEIVESQAGSIFDRKYLEHPQAACRRALYLCHREERLAETLGRTLGEGFDLLDLARVSGLPFEVLEIVEIENLPFRALRQYASLDRQAD
jgi:hypothetical protein